MISLTDKIKMTYKSGFIVIRVLKPNRDGGETLSKPLTYRHPNLARKGIFKNSGVDVTIEQIESARYDLMKHDAVESGIARKESLLAKARGEK